MKSRRIILEDGRYLIFYTFDEERAASSVAGARRGGVAEAQAEEEEEPRGDSVREEPSAPQPVAEEERRV